MFGRTIREQEIADLAEAVADGYCSEGSIDLEVIAKGNSITYSYNDYGTAFDGMLEYHNDKFHIYCNINSTFDPMAPRVRFTFGHELGHYYIDEHRRALKALKNPHPSICEFRSKDIIEKEADHFSANLLMPKGRFLEAVKSLKRTSGLEAIGKLSERFTTSISSTSMRYILLNQMPCAVIKWSVLGKLDWYVTSKPLEQLWLGKTVQRIDMTGRESASNQAFAEGLKIYEAGTTLSTWFSNISAESFDRNQIYVEQAMKLGPYGFITFLRPDSQ